MSVHENHLSECYYEYGKRYAMHGPPMTDFNGFLSSNCATQKNNFEWLRGYLSAANVRLKFRRIADECP